MGVSFHAFVTRMVSSPNRKDPRLKCSQCGRWMRRGLFIGYVQRRPVPFASGCVECPAHNMCRRKPAWGTAKGCYLPHRHWGRCRNAKLKDHLTVVFDPKNKLWACTWARPCGPFGYRIDTPNRLFKKKSEAEALKRMALRGNSEVLRPRTVWEHLEDNSV